MRAYAAIVIYSVFNLQRREEPATHSRHCERSAAIHSFSPRPRRSMDCRAPLAMAGRGHARQHTLAT